VSPSPSYKFYSPSICNPFRAYRSPKTCLQGQRNDTLFAPISGRAIGSRRTAPCAVCSVSWPPLLSSLRRKVIPFPDMVQFSEFAHSLPTHISWLIQLTKRRNADFAIWQIDNESNFVCLLYELVGRKPLVKARTVLQVSALNVELRDCQGPPRRRSASGEPSTTGRLWPPSAVLALKLPCFTDPKPVQSPY